MARSERACGATIDGAVAACEVGLGSELRIAADPAVDRRARHRALPERELWYLRGLPEGDAGAGARCSGLPASARRPAQARGVIAEPLDEMGSWARNGRQRRRMPDGRRRSTTRRTARAGCAPPARPRSLRARATPAQLIASSRAGSSARPIDRVGDRRRAAVGEDQGVLVVDWRTHGRRRARAEAEPPRRPSPRGRCARTPGRPRHR